MTWRRLQVKGLAKGVRCLAPSSGLSASVGPDRADAKKTVSPETGGEGTIENRSSIVSKLLQNSVTTFQISVWLWLRFAALARQSQLSNAVGKTVQEVDFIGRQRAAEDGQIVKVANVTDPNHDRSF